MTLEVRYVYRFTGLRGDDTVEAYTCSRCGAAIIEVSGADDARDLHTRSHGKAGR